MEESPALGKVKGNGCENQDRRVRQLKVTALSVFPRSPGSGHNGYFPHGPNPQLLSDILSSGKFNSILLLPRGVTVASS